MFLYWDGYEIDGSDTDFDIILPEQQQVLEFIKCFLSAPIFDPSTPAEIYTWEKGEQIFFPIEELETVVLEKKHQRLHFFNYCAHPEQLSSEVKKEIYQLSEGRDPHEEGYGKVDNPCISPIPNQVMGLCLLYETAKEASSSGYPIKIEGYTYNSDLFEQKGTNSSPFTLEISVGSYYEYTMYLVNYLKDHYPSIGINGGLDCGGGWTDGCTYASSIYQFEKISFPVPYSVNNTMKRLTEIGLATSYYQNYKRGWQFEELSDFRLANPIGGKETLSYSEYLTYVNTVLEEQKDDSEYFDTICKTAIHIALPKPEFYQYDDTVYQELQKINSEEQDRAYFGFLAFAKQDEDIICEYRIPWKLKSYVEQVAKFVEGGKLDFVKASQYEKRKQND